MVGVAEILMCAYFKTLKNTATKVARRRKRFSDLATIERLSSDFLSQYFVSYCSRPDLLDSIPSELKESEAFPSASDCRKALGLHWDTAWMHCTSQLQSCFLSARPLCVR